MKVNWNFLGAGGGGTKKNSMEAYGYEKLTDLVCLLKMSTDSEDFMK